MAPISAPSTSRLEERLRFEALLADLSSGFVHVEPTEMDRLIEDAQRRVCECLGLDLAALWQLSRDEPGELEMTHLYRPIAGRPVPDEFDPREFNPWTLEKIFAREPVWLRSIDEAPAEAATDCETWRHFDIRSVFCFPLSTGGGSAIGAVSYHAVGEECTWPDEIVQRLELVTQVFANALQRKRSDAILAESEERLQLAAESAEIGIWVLDIERQVFWASDRAREIFGYDPDDEITNERFVESVHPTCREPVSEAMRRSIEDNLPIDIEYRIVLPDGTQRWLHSRGRLQMASAVRPARVLGATQDVTERRTSQDALERSFAEVQALRSRLELENAYLKREYNLQHGSGRVVGESPEIMAVLELVEQVAPTETTVLVEGETGTGKELIAQRIHELGSRGDRPLIKVNCAALPSTLVESELFGREKGAYTGAVSREAGRFEIADGATILLDEIAELPFELQSKLLRVLEEGEFERVGSPRTHNTDVRVIAATNRDLEAEVAAGRFRRDLYFRLAVFPVRVPPLRDRRGDIPLLVWSMVQELGSKMNKAVEDIRRRDMDALQRHDWPGNVRELRNVVERALILCNGPTLSIRPPTAKTTGGGVSMTLDEAQRRYILKVLDSTGGKIRGDEGAARILGMKSSTLRSRMQRLGIDPKLLKSD